MKNLTPSLINHLVLGLLFFLLLLACWNDSKSHRIPNKLIITGGILGILLNTFLPAGAGFISCLPGAIGFWKAIGGLALGLAILLPLYWLRAMGAGDVKLMAMVGAFVGPIPIIGVVLMTFIVGGILAVFTVIRNRTARRLMTNLQTMVIAGFIQASMQEIPDVRSFSGSAGKMPYAIAITGGTLVYFILMGNEKLQILYSLKLF